jgi:hypothetical protein
MASDLHEPPAQTIPKHGPNSIAERDYPLWDYPQQCISLDRSNPELR